MKRILLGLCIMMSMLMYAGGGVVVYSTYNDFKANKGQKYEVFKEMSSVLGKYRVVVRKNGDFVKLKCEEMWGFKIENDLYRTTSSGLYLKLASQGKLFYYENGEAYLSDGVFVKGHYNYLATTIDGELVPIATSDVKADARAKFQKFKDEHPEFLKFFECFDKNPELENCRDCIDRFENPNRVRIFEGYKEP